MKKIENNFAVTGFVGKDAEIRQMLTQVPPSAQRSLEPLDFQGI